MSIFNLFGTRPSLDQGIEKMKNTPGAVLLDVRTSEEYAQGHLPGSTNLPLDAIQTIAMDKSHPLFVYCLSGARSGRACAYLNEAGYCATNIGGVSGYKGTMEVGGGAK